VGEGGPVKEGGGGEGCSYTFARAAPKKCKKAETGCERGLFGLITYVKTWVSREKGGAGSGGGFEFEKSCEKRFKGPGGKGSMGGRS